MTAKTKYIKSDDAIKIILFAIQMYTPCNIEDINTKLIKALVEDNSIELSKDDFYSYWEEMRLW